MNNATHWTERSTEDFLYSIASDFVEQLQSKMATLNKMTRAKLAKAAGISKGRVSQIFNDPGNISLDTAIRLARALGLGVSLLTYENSADPNNERGPVNADVFRNCWERAGRPFDMWDIQRLSRAVPSAVQSYVCIPKGRHAGTQADRKIFAQSLTGASIGGVGSLGWEVLSGTPERRASLRQSMSKITQAS
jgi:transcriptional regulator with XRE-family HTH domain